MLPASSQEPQDTKPHIGLKCCEISFAPYGRNSRHANASCRLRTVANPLTPSIIPLGINTLQRDKNDVL